MSAQPRARPQAQFVTTTGGDIKGETLESGRGRLILRGNAVPGDTASDAGWLVVGRDDDLPAHPFDTRRMEFTGETGGSCSTTRETRS